LMALAVARANPSTSCDASHILVARRTLRAKEKAVG
jgi:hypothetical protein